MIFITDITFIVVINKHYQNTHYKVNSQRKIFLISLKLKYDMIWCI